MCGIHKFDYKQEIQSYHTWTFAGDPNYFPRKGQVCDCGLTRYGEQKAINEITHRLEGV